MKFKSLPVGAVFVFDSEENPQFRFSGMMRGPWIKTSARGYTHQSKGGKYRVDSSNADVIIKNPRKRAKAKRKATKRNPLTNKQKATVRRMLTPKRKTKVPAIYVQKFHSPGKWVTIAVFPLNQQAAAIIVAKTLRDKLNGTYRVVKP